MTTSALSGGMLVAWHPPHTEGASPVTAYVVRVCTGERIASTDHVSGETLTDRVIGLLKGPTYSVSVAAVNVLGVGPPSTRTARVAPQCAPTPAIAGSPPATATVGVPYHFAFSLGGRPVPTATVTAGSLPPGLSLSTGGLLSGTPMLAGNYRATVTASNGAPPAAMTTFTVVVSAVVTLSPPSGPPGTDVSLDALGFLPGETATAKYNVGVGSWVVLCQGVVSPTGELVCQAAIPAGAGALGAHQVRVHGPTYGYVAKTNFTVTS